MTLSEVSPEPGEARTDTNDIKLPNGRDIYGTYKKAATHLHFYQWMPPFNLMYELVDEPLSPGQLQYIWNMISLVTALLLNVTLTAPLSLAYSDLQDLNDRFRNDSNMHKVFEQLAMRIGASQEEQQISTRTSIPTVCCDSIHLALVS